MFFFHREFLIKAHLLSGYDNWENAGTKAYVDEKYFKILEFKIFKIYFKPFSLLYVMMIRPQVVLSI